MSSKKLYGYVDNKLIASGFLIPIYIDILTDELYFHELSPDNKKIIGFQKFDSGTFKKDKLTELNPYRELFFSSSEQAESFFIIKSQNEITCATFSEAVSFFSKNILEKKITSRILIANATKLFNKSLTDEIKKDTVVVLSSLEGIGKIKITDFLRRCEGNRVIKIAEGKDGEFQDYCEDLITSKNRRVIFLPDGVSIDFSQEHNVIIFTSSQQRVEHKLFYKIQFDSLQNKKQANYNKIWRFKCVGKNEYENTIFSSRHSIGLNMAIIANKLKETFVIPKDESNNPFLEMDKLKAITK